MTPTFHFSTQEDWKLEIEIVDHLSNPIDLRNRTFEMPLTPVGLATIRTLVPTLVNTNKLVATVSAAEAATFRRGEYTVDLIETTGGVRDRFIPMRLVYNEPGYLTGKQDTFQRITLHPNSQKAVLPGIPGPKGDITLELEQLRDTTLGARDQALVAETNAETAEAGAVVARTAAEGARDAAQTAQSAAEAARTGAETARNQAQAAETNAAGSASNAASSATDAAASASAAQTARTGAETAQSAAETARTGAETARTGAETARTGAEAARDLAQRWAEEADGVDVDGVGTRSARHHANRAEAALTDINAGLASKADKLAPLFIKQDTNVEGGQIAFERADNSVLANNVVVDLHDGLFRIYEISSGKGYSLDLAALPGWVSAWHSGNFNPATKANLDSPALTGTPTAPTPASGTNTTQLATTAFVQAAIAALADSAPETLNTLNELAAALGDDPNFATTITNELAKKADLSGATFSGLVSFPIGGVTVRKDPAAGSSEGGDIYLELSNNTTALTGTRLTIDQYANQLRIFALDNQATPASKGVFVDFAEDFTGIQRLWHAGNFNPATKASLSGATFTGRVTASDGFQLGGLYPEHAYRFGGATDTAWKRIATVTCTNALYAGASFIVTAIDASTNHGHSPDAQQMLFTVACYRSGATADVPDAAYVGGPNADYVRVVKTATGVYEIQVRQPVSYKHVAFKVQQISGLKSSVSYETGTPPNGNTTGTIYTATATGRFHAANASFLGDVKIAGNDVLHTGNANEVIDDRVATLIQAGAGITITYDDAANTLTLQASSVSDHGSLTGLLDDDHPQYAKKAGDTFTGTIQAPYLRLPAVGRNYFVKGGTSADQIEIGRRTASDTVDTADIILNASGHTLFRQSVHIGPSTPGALLAGRLGLSIGDSDTGITQDGDGVLKIVTNNGDRVTINSTGVGINTTSPGSKLEVRDGLYSWNQNIDYLRFGVAGGQWMGGIGLRSNSGGLPRVFIDAMLDGAGTRYEAMSFSTAKRVGIGVQYASAKLHVVGDGIFDAAKTDTTGTVELRVPDGANGRQSSLRFHGTFENSADTGDRYVASLRAGFDGGAWGTEFLDVWTNFGASNDGRYDASQVRVARFNNKGVNIFRGLQYNNAPIYHAAFWGVSTSNNAATNTTNLNQCIADVKAAGGGRIMLPRGVIDLNNITISNGNSITLEGQGAFGGGTTLRAMSTSGDFISFTTCQHAGIRDCYISAGVRRTSGYAVAFKTNCFMCAFVDSRIDYHWAALLVYSSAETHVSNVHFRYLHGYNGFWMGGAAGAGSYRAFIHNLRCDNPYPIDANGPRKTWAASTAFAVGDIIVSNNRIYQCSQAGTSGSTAPSGIPGTGPTDAFSAEIVDGTCRWRFVSGDVLTWVELANYGYSLVINGLAAISGGHGVRMTDSANTGSSYPMWIFAFDVECDHNYFDAIVLDRGEGYFATTSWIGSSLSGNGIVIGPNFRGEVKIDGHRILGNWYHGILLYAGPRNVIINANHIGANSQAQSGAYHGITVGGGAQRFTITNNHIGQLAHGGSTQGYGVIVQSGSSDRYVISGNLVSENISGGVADGGSGTNKWVAGNV